MSGSYRISCLRFVNSGFGKVASFGTVACATALCATSFFLSRAAVAAPPIALHSSSSASISKTDTALGAVLQTVQPETRGWTNVLVQLAPGTTVAQAKNALARLNGDVYRHLDLIHGLAVRVPTRNLAALARAEWAVHLSADAETRKSDDFTVKHSGAAVAQAPVLPAGWGNSGYGLSGSGVTIAVLDSGIIKNGDFNDASNNTRIVGAANFAPDDKGNVSASNTDDKLGHGTHVAGIIAGNGKASTGTQFYQTFKGIAPAAKLVNVRVLDAQGSGTVSNVIAGLNWIVQNKAKYNIRVVNVSLGHPVYESYKTDPLNKAVEAAWQAGIFVVCSAGNDGRMGDSSGAYPGDNEGYGTQYGTIQCPGNDPLVITVGAMKNTDTYQPHDKVATYSSRGPSRIDMVVKPDIMAPGNRVVSVCADKSTLDVAYAGTNDIKMYEFQTNGKDEYSKQYFELSGTSMAAPVVAGAAALLLQKDGSLSPDTLKARLMLSADKWLSPKGTPDVLTYGAGYIDIVGALNDTTVVASNTVANSPNMVATNNGTLTVFMDQALWGKASAYKTSVSSLQALWGKASCKVSDTVAADQALWGKARNVQANNGSWGSATASSVDISSKSVNGE